MGYAVDAAPESHFCGAWEAASTCNRPARPPTAPQRRPGTATQRPDDNQVTQKPIRPMTAGGRIGNRVFDLKVESDTYSKGVAQVLAVNTEVGPSSYDAMTAYKKCTIPQTPRCNFSSGSRLSILSDKEVKETNGQENANYVPKLNLTNMEAKTTTRSRPQSARIAHRPGRGHWLDGIATGCTIAGVYNRFLSSGPGVSTYDIGKARDLITAHSPRCTFGSSSRFPGGSKVSGPPPRKNHGAIPLPKFEVKGAASTLGHKPKPPPSNRQKAATATSRTKQQPAIAVEAP